jgi:NAD(P)-dependent dehydrogenase (short-subunit alcohol dehydrogenase family)
LTALGGRVDILVNNAGGARLVTDEVDDAFWDEALTLNFLAARRLTDLIVPGMKAQNWGRIVSISGALVAPKLNGAAPAKAAPVSWSRTLSSELGAHGITVNTIAPGRINSAQIQKLHPTEQSRAEFIKQNIPAGYFGEPHDIGHLAAFSRLPARPLYQSRGDPGRWRGGASSVGIRHWTSFTLSPVPEFAEGVAAPHGDRPFDRHLAAQVCGAHQPQDCSGAN